MPKTLTAGHRPLLLVAALLLAAGLAAGCVTTDTFVAPERQADPTPALPSGEVAHRVYLLGNTGDLRGGAQSPVLRALRADVEGADTDATVVVLGDVTADGLPPADAPDRAAAEAPARALLAALAPFGNDVVVVPGDRDWARGEDGVQRLEDLLEDEFDANVLTPGDQAGGPREDKLADGLRLVVLDTAWWLLPDGERPDGEAEDQRIRTPGDVARVFDQIVTDRDDDRIVVAAHHPLVSRGPRAGYRGDPFQAFLGRTVGLGRQDLSAPGYRGLRETLGRIARRHDGLVWASAHDPILSVEDERVDPLTVLTHLSSGTAGGAGAGFNAGEAVYLSARPGYQRLVYYADGRLWAEVVELDGAGAPRVVLRHQVAGPIPELLDPDVPDVRPGDLPREIGGTVTQSLDADFEGDPFANDALTRAMLGELYRDLWKAEATFDVLDMGTEAGGLTPVKRGGGKQTIGLRLVGEDGHEYGLRLLQKAGSQQVPAELRDGLAGDLVLELQAALTPYAALTAAALAPAAGVTQPSPRIVYVPDDPRLGRYRDTFGGRLATFEVRPDDDMSDVPGFEGMNDVISSSSLREELREDQDHRVDQRTFLRARLFDMVLGDWDRHADQWRWAAFEPEDLDPSLSGDEATRGKVYRPIARDRDFALYGIGGLIQPVLAVFDNRLQPADDDFDSIEGLTHNGFYQDRRFLNTLTRDDWLAAAEDLQARLTDAAIDRAARAVPAEVQPLVSDYWSDVLRARRDALIDAAEAYYEMQATTVDVIGSDERELFEVERAPGGRMTVTVRSYKGGEPGAELYRRVFDPADTHEVRLYALGGRDVIRVTGPPGISVRVIGGAGEDRVEAPDGDVDVYDTPDGMAVQGRVEDRRSTDADVNRYDPAEQVLGDRQYRPVVGFRATDGVVLGASVEWLVPGFRLHPFAATHRLQATIATATGGVAGSYDALMREALGSTDLSINAFASTPRYARNFYGLGNGSPDIDPDLARIDLARVEGRAGLSFPVGERFRIDGGPMARFADASVPDVASVATLGLPASAFEAQTHGGLFVSAEASTARASANPQGGVRLSAFGEALAGLSGPAGEYGRVGGEAVAYLPLRRAPQLTLALRGGAETLIGEFPFFDAAVLGGPGTVRGYRRERFAGRSAASASAELRAKLLTLDTYALPLHVGLLGFADAGRIWDADSPFPTATFDGDGTQLGYGGGLWFGLLDRAVLNVTAGVSDETTLVTVGLGFAY